MLTSRKITLSINDIYIPDSFRRTPPKPEKIAERYAAWYKNGAIPGAIIINKDHVMIDGYATYMVHRMVGSKQIQCYRIEDRELDAEVKYLKLLLRKVQNVVEGKYERT